MELDLSVFFSTKAQAQSFSSGLSALSEKIYQTGFNIENILLNEFGIEKKEKFLKILRENNINTQSASELKTFIDKLILQIAQLPVLTLTIAFEPKEANLKIFAEWFVLNLNKQVIFDIVIDASLIGGAALTYKGKFMDYSIRPEFEKIADKILRKSNQSILNPVTLADQIEEHAKQNQQ